MQYVNKWTFGVTLLLIAAVSSTSLAHRRGYFFRWWKQPPAEPILDVDIPLELDRAGLKQAQFGNGVYQKTRTELDTLDAQTPLSVVSEEVTNPPIMVSGTDADISFDFPDPAPLNQHYFGSSFYKMGTATVTTPSGTTNVPVRACGHISERDGTYYLKETIYGYVRDEDTNTGTTTVTLLKVRLTGNAPVPTTPAPVPAASSP